MSLRKSRATSSPSTARDIASVALLDDPVRARLFAHVSSSVEPVSRDDAAAIVGVSRRIAAFHLDRLVEDGLLEVSFRRLSGKTGPGAGRPSKLYLRSGKRVAVSLPPRNYESLARLVVEAVERSDRGSAVDRLKPGARAYGKSIGRTARARIPGAPAKGELVKTLTEELDSQGFEPVRVDKRTMRLRNCPYHEMARENPGMVCELNLALIEGMTDGLGLSDVEPRLTPEDGWCCVTLPLPAKQKDT